MERAVQMNVSNDTSDSKTGNFTFEDNRLPDYVQVIIVLMYTTVSVVAVGGNFIVCYTVYSYQRMRTVTNFFIVNLACSDILMSVLCIPLTFIANMIMQYWPFGHVMCPIVTYSQVMVVFLSAFTLVAISIDRYVAVVYPLRPRMTSTQAVVIIAVIWILAIIAPLPVAILSQIVYRYDHTGKVREYCEEVWENRQYKMNYTLAIMILQYFVPLFVLMSTYTRIGIIIWIKKPPGEADNRRDNRMAASKKKMVKMMITVVIIYALCWLPFHTVTIIGDLHPEVYDYSYMNAVWICCHWLAMSSCCCNPIVYCWMNSRFRNGFRYVLRCCPFVQYDRSQDDAHMSVCMSKLKTSSARQSSKSAQRRHDNTYRLCRVQEASPTSMDKPRDMRINNGHRIHR